MIKSEKRSPPARVTAIERGGQPELSATTGRLFMESASRVGQRAPIVLLSLVAKTDAAAFAHMTGFQGEVRVAADAANRGEVVVSWGGKVGTQGADVISVNPKTGDVILYDAKTYSNATNVKPSTTFKPGSDALKNARQGALDAIEASNLPPALLQQARQNVLVGNFTTRTTNQGVGGSSPITVNFCAGVVCK